MTIHRTLIALLIIAAFTVTAGADDQPETEPQYERPIYRLVLKVSAKKLDREQIRTALATLKGVKGVELREHEEGLEAWIDRDTENSLSKRDIKKSLADTPASLEETQERWLRADGELLPVPMDKKTLTSMKPKTFYVEGRTLLYKITTTSPDGESTVVYKRTVYDEIKFQNDTYMNLHWRVFHMDNERKLERIENVGGMQNAHDNKGKTEDVDTALGKLECEKQPGTRSSNVVQEDGTSREIKFSVDTWILNDVNLKVRIEEQSDDGEGNTSLVVTELIEVG